MFNSPSPPIALDPCRKSLVTYLLDRELKHNPDQTCYIDGVSSEVVTRAQHWKRVSFFAAALRNLQAAGLYELKKGSTAIVFSPNSVLYPVLMFAFSANGIRPAYANANYIEGELAHAFKVSHATHVLVHPSLFPVVQRGLATLGYSAQDQKKRVLVLAADKDLPQDLLAEGWVGLDRLVPHPSLRLPERFDGPASDETAALYFSSGTSGLNKAIALTHLNITFAIASMEASWQWYTSGSVVLTVLPFYHIYGACNGVLLHIAMGIPFVLLPRFIPEHFLGAIDKYKVSALPLVPPLVNFLCLSPLVDQYDLRSVKFVAAGAAPVIPSSYDRLSERFAKRGVHLDLAVGYGLTETTGMITYVPSEKVNEKKGSIGVLLPNSEGRIVDEDGVDVPTGQSGEIWLRSPAIMKEYVGNTEATKQTITPDGWLQTGDIGLVDKDGYLFIVDRKKELIKFKGLQVAPMELEAILSEHPAVADSAVIGIMQEDGNELPRAYIAPKDPKVLQEDNSALARDIAEWVKRRVAHYKQLRGGVMFVDTVPRSQAGKILRRVLRDAARTSSPASARL